MKLQFWYNLNIINVYMSNINYANYYLYTFIILKSSQYCRFSIYLFYNKYNAKMDLIGCFYNNHVVFRIQLGINELK